MPEKAFVDVKVNSATNGSVYFASDVICTIAGLALTEVEGVVTFAKNSMQRNEKNIKKNTVNIKNLTRGIKAEVKDNRVSLTITTVVEYGHSVPEVSKNIQENVKKTVETMTGMNVQSVDVHISGLSFEKENSLPGDGEYQYYISGSKTKAIEEAAEQKNKEE